MSHIYVTKLLIETQSPMVISSGYTEVGFDNQLARDANGLPYIPASTIAGVWGSLVRQQLGEEQRNKWFGTTEQASSLVISHAILHNSKNQPIPALLKKETINQDSLLSLLALARPLHRERVALNDRGVAKETAKFDHILLPKGVRFSLSLKWHACSRANNQILDEQQWQELLALWSDRQFSIGAGTRNGLGRINVIACQQCCFNLSHGTATWYAFQKFMNEPHIDQGVLPASKEPLRPFAKLSLQALDNWRCGSGSSLISGQPYENNTVSLITYSEPYIKWENNQAFLAENQPILCGSSIKGIIAHRMAYHLRRHRQIWATDMADQTHNEWQQMPKELTQLFGCASENDSEGIAGKLYIDDAKLQHYQTIIRKHNKIDRFTGGVQLGGLYTEELLYKPQFTVTLWLKPNTEVSESVKKAFSDTIEDLKMGLLPMGAGSGRGNSLVMPQPEGKWEINLAMLKTLHTVKEQ